MQTDQKATQEGDLGDVCAQWVNSFTRRLLPPSDGFIDDDFLKSLKNRIGCEAISVFLLPEVKLDAAPQQWDFDPSSRLKLHAAVGYFENYWRHEYHLKEAALTSWVFTHQRAVSVSKVELKRRSESENEQERLGFSDTCHLYIETREFRNVIASPIMCPSGCVGVLKFENKLGRNENEAFPEEDFALAKALAAMLGWAYEQRRFGVFWSRCESAKARCRTETALLEETCYILRTWLRCQCVSFFLRRLEQKEEMLAYTAGVGYLPVYRQHMYSLNKQSANHLPSLTGFVFERGISIRRSERQLEKPAAGESRVPYSGACRNYIGTFRNLLALPLQHGDHRLGVLKLENKNPDTVEQFNDYDERVCWALLERLLVPRLVEMQAGGAGLSALRSLGFAKLVERFGPTRKLRKEQLRRRLAEIWGELGQTASDIKAEDWAAYFQISLPHAYRLLRQQRST